MDQEEIEVEMFMIFIGIICDLGGILLFVVGLVALIRGKISFTKGHELNGRQARLAGAGLIVLGILLEVLWQAIAH